MENNDVRKFCPYCGVENDPSYSFCKNCGKPLRVQSGVDFNAASFGNEINGVPVAEVADYIGKNSDRYIPKFFRFSKGNKADWNWPVFLFGLLGIPFVWFFHRKMYKWGSIMLAISVAISIATSCVIGSVLSFIKEPFLEIIDETIAITQNDYYYDYDDEFILSSDVEEELEEKYNDLFEDIMQSDELISISLFSNLLSIINLAYLIIVPIFANVLYYNKAFDDLRKINGGGVITPEIVRSTGGTSAAASVLSGIFAYISMQLILYIPFILFIANIFINSINL